MSKRLPPNDPSRPPVRLRLPQISLQELKTIRVAIRRKDVPQDLVATGPLIRSLDDPEDLVLHKPGKIYTFKLYSLLIQFAP
uniref:Transformer n=1 Tax=Trypoxylus dichotomus TaxID=273928 RepID=A0A499UA25_TRYDI|nr:transformer [Trypoxylus dichotomus]